MCTGSVGVLRLLMNRIRRGFYKKIRAFRSYVIFVLFILCVYYSYPRKIKFLDIRNSWKADIDTTLQRQIESYSSNIFGVKNFINRYGYFTEMYHFLHLPKRLKHVSFSEMTSANPDTANPLSPDFSFHLSYGKKEAKIFEDYGCGCIYRIYLLPPFSSFQDKIHSLTLSDMENLKIVVELDERPSTYSLKQIMVGNKYPFLYPLTSSNRKPISGIGAFTQLCYEKSARIYYFDDNDYPENILNMTVDCVSNELKCPIKQYSGISYLKVPLSLQKSTMDINKENIVDLDTLAKLLQNPVLSGPHSEVGCKLFCSPLIQNKALTLYDAINYSGIITSMLLTVLDYEGNNWDWSDIFLVANFDESSSPQVNVSIESLFISQGIANDFKGAAYGRLEMRCYYGLENEFRKDGLLKVGYLYMPMPFWKSAKIRLVHLATSSRLRWKPKLVCFQLTEAKNFYNPNLTGHLHISQVFHSGQTERRREVIRITNGWGHLVGVGVEVHNLRPNLRGSLIERWAALQADPLIFIDYLRTPRVRGTGLEDYFNYAHGFAEAANTSYSFVGVPLALSTSSFGNTWICYRQHILDPIPFDESLEFIMEGTDKSLYKSKVESVSYNHFRKKLSNKETAFTYVALFYYKTHSISSGDEFCDEIIMCDEHSLIDHNFLSSKKGMPFSIEPAYFIGDVKSDHPSDITCGISFSNHTVLSFVLSLPVSHGSKFLLKRTFHMQPFQWNDLCQVEVNGLNLGLWGFPMGPTTPKYSLREESMEIFISDDNKKKIINGEQIFSFRITVLTIWRDVSYKICKIK